MIIKCSNCGGALKFDSVSGKMKCGYCDSKFEPSEIPQKEKSKQDTMECNIYSCTSCGAELAVNGVEAASFCAYCGQPTIVFNRVSHELKPELIIPFKTTKEYAIYAIRKRFSKGKYIPSEVKNFDVERVCGIYIPYWLFDVYYYDRQIIETVFRNSKTAITIHCLRAAECNFENLTLDASSNLNDEISQRLEPYNMRALCPFEVGYLSGFHADRYDMENTELYDLVETRTQELFDEEMLKTCKGDERKIISKNPRMRIEKETYAMLPAWFMTFRYQGRPYTMLVNGQTGKLVGAVPFDKEKAWKTGIAWFIALSFIWIPIVSKIFSIIPQNGKSILWMFFFTAMACFLILVWGIVKLSCMKQSMELTTSRHVNQFANDRQEV